MSRSFRRRLTLVVLTAVVTGACVVLGAWQLARLSSRRALNDVLLTRAKQPAVSLTALTGVRGGHDDPNAYRRVEATGRYDVAHEIVLRARADAAGHGGNHVLTPLVLGDGTAIVVDRGWVPLAMDAPGDGAARPPPGETRVAGLLIPSESKPRFFGPSDPATGSLRSIGRIDLTRIAKQTPYRIVPLYLALQEQRPPQQTLPVPAGYPAPGVGPHFSYAVQWFLFATISLVTGILLLRRERQPIVQPPSSSSAR